MRIFLKVNCFETDTSLLNFNSIYKNVILIMGEKKKKKNEFDQLKKNLKQNKNFLNIILQNRPFHIVFI